MTTYVFGRDGHYYFTLFPIEYLDGYAANGVISRRVRSIGTFDASTWREAKLMVDGYMGYGVYPATGAL